MPWPCYMVEYIGQSEPRALPGGGSMTRSQWKDDRGQIVEIEGLRPGAMWMDDERGLCVLLPCRTIFYPDRPDRTWKRNGKPPKVTVTPSINVVGWYHGYLTDGALTSDHEGRKFKDEPA